MAFFASLTSKMAEQLTMGKLDELTLEEAELVTGGAEGSTSSQLGAEATL